MLTLHRECALSDTLCINVVYVLARTGVEFGINFMGMARK